MLRTNILEGQMPYNKDKPDFWDKTPETYAETPEYPDGVYLKADGKPDPRKGKLSNRQRTFAELIVEGVYSNAECARRAGFSEVTASDYATKLLNGVDFPHVVELITELRRSVSASTVSPSSVSSPALPSSLRGRRSPTSIRLLSSRKSCALPWVV
jgi:DNA-binding CsgD family transcriptional regulator